MSFNFEKLPKDSQYTTLTFMNDQLLAAILQANKSIYNLGKNLLRSNRLAGIAFFNQQRQEKWKAFKKDLNEEVTSKILQALHWILCKKENYDEAFATLKKYVSYPFVHQHVTCFILRERWHYQDRTVLVNTLELAEIGADEYANRECCMLLASIFAKGLILRGGDKYKQLVFQDDDKAKKYIMKLIDLSLGFGKGDEYAEELGEKLFALVGQGAGQVIRIFTLEELQAISKETLSAFAFCSNAKDLFNFLNSGVKNRTELINLLNLKMNMVNPIEKSSLCMLATLLLSNNNYELALEYNNCFPFKIAMKGKTHKYYIPLVVNNGVLNYQESLNYHFSLGLEIDDYFNYFAERPDENGRCKTYVWRIDSGFAKNFLRMDEMGKVIVPPALAATLIGITKDWETIEKRLELLKNFVDEYSKLQTHIHKPEQFKKIFASLPILSHPKLSVEQRESLHQQIFYHMAELKCLQLSTESNTRRLSLSL